MDKSPCGKFTPPRLISASIVRITARESYRPGGGLVARGFSKRIRAGSFIEFGLLRENFLDLYNLKKLFF